MILIADSGSTKTDWCLTKDGLQTNIFHTIGYNPYFIDTEAIYYSLSENLLKDLDSKCVSKIYFYGAGCSAPNLNVIIQRGIEQVFQSAKVTVEHDLMACAYSTYEGRPAISCILGTGSNSCFFDGKDVSEEVPALGYILGDEGSGSYFGKKLITDFLYHKLPSNIEKRMFSEGWDKDKLVDHIYRLPHANVFLASFMPVIVDFKDEPYIIEMVKEGFNHFVQNHVLCFKNCREVDVNFVGSIAHFFEDELREVCSLHKIRLSNIVRRPIDGLIHYHQQKLVNA
jgi:N-acetylglucosamine kinase-like BadF-type ATPase